MNDYRRINLADVDLTILERISEDDVARWLVAKLAKIRATSDPTAYTIDLYVWHRNYCCDEHYDFAVSVSLQGGRGYTHPSLDSALIEARLEQMKRPDERARKARQKASQLTAEAEQLEAIAASAKTGGITS